MDLSFLVLDDREISFIKERYPLVDLHNLDKPMIGMATVTYFDYLESSVRNDLDYKNFEKCADPLTALNICSSIDEKIRKCKLTHEPQGKFKDGSEIRKIEVYNEENVALNGMIIDGCLSLESNVYGEEYNSEMHYRFSKNETRKLFRTISEEDFIALCKERRVTGMEKFLNDNDIRYECTVI